MHACVRACECVGVCGRHCVAWRLTFTRFCAIFAVASCILRDIFSASCTANSLLSSFPTSSITSCACMRACMRACRVLHRDGLRTSQYIHMYGQVGEDRCVAAVRFKRRVVGMAGIGIDQLNNLACVPCMPAFAFRSIMWGATCVWMAWRSYYQIHDYYMHNISITCCNVWMVWLGTAIWPPVQYAPP